MADRFTPKSGAAGPLDALDQDPFGVDTYTYPMNINTLAHAMLFNINVSDKSTYVSGTSSTNEALATSGTSQSRSQQLRNGQILGLEATLGGKKIGTQRKTKRIQKSVALYTPETIVFDQNQQYNTPELTPLVGDIASRVVGGAIGLMEGIASHFGGLGAITGMVIGGTAGAGVGALTNPTGEVATIGQIATGYAINPVIEVLYGHPELRQFQFDFNFAPESRVEATNIFNIIQTFRMFSAPEFVGTGKGISGAFFIPPAEWDITFLRQDTTGSFIQNTNIPTISTCVLTTINVNYTPDGQWITLVDGFPAHIQMRLSFMEIDIMTADRIDAGF